MIRSKIASNLKALIYASLSRLKFNIGGQLGVNEIQALIDSLSISSWRNLYRNVPDVKKINLAYLGILFSQMVSDLVNHSLTYNYIRGWANIIMAIVVTNFLTKLLWNNNKAIVYYLVGTIITTTIFGAELDDFALEKMGFFKFTLAPIINSASLIIAWYFIQKSTKNFKYVIAIFIAYSLFNLVFDYRSNGVIFLVMAVLLYYRGVFKKIMLRNIIPYIVIALIVFQGLYSLYVSQVLSGSIGGEHSVEQLKRVENPYNPVYLLMTGRSETVVALYAIEDSPFFGHGSWAPDPGGKYTRMAYALHGNEDRFESKLETDNGQLIIPSHSVIIGIWMTAGLGGFAFMLYIIILFYKRGFALLRSDAFNQNAYMPIAIFFMTNGAWVFLFSPLPHIKQSLPIIIAFLLVSYRKQEIIKLSALKKINVIKNRLNSDNQISATVKLSHL